ncbi:sulfurtransferase [Plakobranchus ocellatus]|uniref:Sulfurtransferase n=1 Tax=Plakobranchus ocellatus TaxID=259542 RepID=A0AAV4A597_9GAST|nr:sulfurtransferase [Plakobranchus ocellatus]
MALQYQELPVGTPVDWRQHFVMPHKKTMQVWFHFNHPKTVVNVKKSVKYFHFVSRPFRVLDFRKASLLNRLLKISSDSSNTQPPSSRPSIALISSDNRPALVTTQWLKDALVLTYESLGNHCVKTGDATHRSSQGAIFLEELQHNPICLLDTSWKFDSGFDGYEQCFKQGHIPGSTFLDLRALSSPQRDKGEDCPIPDPNLFQRYVSSLGVTSNTHVITYDSLDSRPAARAWFLFRLFGHDRVSVLDGGLRKWKSDGFDVCDGERGRNCQREEIRLNLGTELEFKPILHTELLRDFKEMKAIVQNGGVQVIDCRPAEGCFYTSSASKETSAEETLPSPSRASAPGHMPGAINLPSSNVFRADGTFKSELELYQLFQAAGVDLSAPAVVTSQRGVSSCSIALAAFLLGTPDLPIYNGSWTEWQALAPPSLTVKTND